MNIMKLKKIDTKKRNKKITEKFKELKSLVYNYRDLKEKEISELSKNQDNLKMKLKLIEMIMKLLVDKTTIE